MKRKKGARSAGGQNEGYAPSDRITLPIVGLVTLVLVAYWNSLDGGFHFDDQGIFLDPYVMGPGFGWRILRIMQTRPLTFLTFHWNYIGNGANGWGFHLVDLLLHLLSSVLLFFIAGTLLPRFLAWFAAALFAVHPLQTQAVNYVFERATLLATLFALLSLYLFLKARYPWSVAAFGLSLLAKEETIALPAFLLLYAVLANLPRGARRCCVLMSGLSALAAARLFYVLRSTPDARLGFGTQGVSVISYGLTQCRVIWIYVRFLVLPIGLSLEHDVKLSRNVWSPPATLPAMLLLALSIGTLAWMAWRRNAPALWMLGFFILLSPSSSIVPASDLIFEHRTYLPMACLAVAVALLLSRFRPPPPFLPLTLLLAMLLAATMAQNRVWHDERSLWTDAIEKSPYKALGYFHLGQAYASSDPARARELYEKGLKLDPVNAAGQTNLGLILLSQGHPETAVQHFQEALRDGGENTLVWNNIGVAELRLGHIEEAIRSFRHALQSEPCRFDARYNLVHTLSYRGEKDNALLAARIPVDCHLLPEQVLKLEDSVRALR